MTVIYECVWCGRVADVVYSRFLKTKQWVTCDECKKKRGKDDADT